MKEGMWYKVIDASDPPAKMDSVCRLTVGDFWLLSKDDGSALPKFTSVDGEWCFLKKDRFDPTPYIRKASGRFAPEKEESVKEGKFYRCIESSAYTEEGEFCKLLKNDKSSAFFYETPRCGGKWIRNQCFDPTPHERTVFPNAPDLIERVRRIDPAAAEWLEFGDHSRVVNFDAGRCNLDDVMIWSTTPQGHNYWERLHEAVDYEEETPMPKDDFKKGERVEVRDDEDEDWEEATFLCMDEESEFPYVAKPYGVADGFKFCRRPQPQAARPRIEPGTPIEVWDEDAKYTELRRFGCWTGLGAWVVRDSDDTGWKHCRVLAPTGVEV